LASALSDERPYVHPEHCLSLQAGHTICAAAEPLLSARHMDPDDSLSVSVNGEHRRVPGGISIVEMLNELGLDPGRVAVERNLGVVPRSSFRDICVEDGDSFEIVHFVGGG